MRFRFVRKLLLVLLLGSACAGATSPPATTPTSARSYIAPPARFPTWGIEFTPPVGWKRIAEPDFTIVANFAPADGSEGTLRVVCVPVMQNSLAELAGTIAKRIGGKAAADTLGGRPAQLVSGGRQGEASLVSQRSGYIFEMLYQRRLPAYNLDDLKVIRGSWRWIEQSPPYKEKTQRTEPIELLHTFWIRPAEHIRPWPIAKAPPGHVILAAVDVGSQRILKEFQVDISMPAELQGVSLDDITNKLSGALAEEFKTRRRPGFSNAGERADRVISQTVHERDAAERLKRASIKGVAALDDHRRVLLDFLITTSNEDVMEGFAGMAGTMVESIEPIPATGPTSQPAR